MSIMIMANRAYRFANPNASLSSTNKSGVKVTQDFKEAYAEVHPDEKSGAFGNITQVPDWVADDRMYKMAVADGNIVRIYDKPSVSLDPGEPTEAEKQRLVNTGAGQAAAAQAGVTAVPPVSKTADGTPAPPENPTPDASQEPEANGKKKK